MTEGAAAAKINVINHEMTQLNQKLQDSVENIEADGRGAGSRRRPAQGIRHEEVDGAHPARNGAKRQRKKHQADQQNQNTSRSRKAQSPRKRSPQTKEDLQLAGKDQEDSKKTRYRRKDQPDPGLGPIASQRPPKGKAPLPPPSFNKKVETQRFRSNQLGQNGEPVFSIDLSQVSQQKV